MALPDASTLRRPGVDDHARVLAAIVAWWPGGRGAELAPLLPRLFFQHFTGISHILDDADGGLRGFLIGFRSADHPEVAYIHFVGVDPALRGQGVARSLYEMFFAEVAALGCTRVDAITGPPNTQSQAFHRAMGFEVTGPVDDYDGPGEARMTMSRTLS
jgi:ribosomal protein S18 acetylase RimI-like enzyme